MTNFWDILFYIILPLVIIVFIILLGYDYYQYVNQASTKIEDPYVLLIKPVILDIGQNLNIYLSTLPGSILKNVSLFVLEPDAKSVILYETKNISQTVLKNVSLSSSFTKEGNYSLILTNNSINKSIMSTEFMVKPWYIVFLKYIFGQGLGFLIGIVGPLITILLDRAVKRHDENTARLQNKSDWMGSNLKYYSNSASSAEKIYKYFRDLPKKYSNFNRIKDLVKYLLEFWINYEKMAENIGYFYFEDNRQEILVSELGKHILTTIMSMFRGGDFNKLLELYKISGFINTSDDNMSGIGEWLMDNKQGINNFNELPKDKSNKIREFYLDTLLYCWLLKTAITNAMLVTYENPKSEKHEHYSKLKMHKDELLEQIKKWDDSLIDKKRITQPSNFFKGYERWYKTSFQNLISTSDFILLALAASLAVGDLINFYYHLSNAVSISLAIIELVLVTAIVIILIGKFIRRTL